MRRNKVAYLSSHHNSPHRSSSHDIDASVFVPPLNSEKLSILLSHSPLRSLFPRPPNDHDIVMILSCMRTCSVSASQLFSHVVHSVSIGYEVDSVIDTISLIHEQN